MKTEVPFAMQEGKGASPQNSQETLINMYAEPDLGRKQLVRRQRPGIKSVPISDLSLGNPVVGIAQGIEPWIGSFCLVIGGRFVRCDEDGVSAASQSMSIIDPGAPVTMAFNDNNEALVCDGTYAFYGDALGGGGFNIVTDAGNHFEAGTCTALGGYGIFNEPNTSKFFITDLNDFQIVDPLNFASAESYQDNIVRVFRLGNELLLFGQTSTEFWALSGGTDFPFSPITNAVVRRGIIGPLAVTAEDNTAFFVGEDFIVYRLEGYRPVRISTQAVERLIDELPEDAKPNCRAMVYTYQGSKFITLTWVGHLTLQYNAATQLWNRAKTRGLEHLDLIGSANGSTTRFLSDNVIFCELDGTQFYDDRAASEKVAIERKAISAPGYAGGNKITLESLEIDVEVGLTEPFNRNTIGGPDSLITTGPEIMLRIARDGMTFGNERKKTLGALGNYRKKVIWRNGGWGEKIVAEVSVTDPCLLTIMGAEVELDVEQ